VKRLTALAWLGLALAPSAARAAGGEGGSSDLVWRVVNVALLLVVLVVVARKPIRGFFAERHDRIANDVESAARQRKEAEERYARLQRQVAALDTELEGIRVTARERAAAERERMLEDARAAAERIRREARLAVDQELRRARQELRREAADLSIELAGDLLARQVTEADRDRLIDELIARVESPPAGSGR
jgi:F-type H+-transporting ATPase subunit b